MTGVQAGLVHHQAVVMRRRREMRSRSCVAKLFDRHLCGDSLTFEAAKLLHHLPKMGRMVMFSLGDLVGKEAPHVPQADAFERRIVKKLESMGSLRSAICIGIDYGMAS
ncbi:hypothetical protein PG996_007952 [Apiospora saccharicola]|uniref:Uncharacterized protein n=1 Tax=Apiospora saccharicola TaxID=335842 RepID=A0ABR1UWI9_9PEZI